MHTQRRRRYENTRKPCGDGPPCGHGAALLPVMVCAVAMGVAGFLCAIFIPVLGGYALLDVLRMSTPLSLHAIFWLSLIHI